MIILNIIIDLKVAQEDEPTKGALGARAHCEPAQGLGPWPDLIRSLQIIGSKSVKWGPYEGGAILGPGIKIITPNPSPSCKDYGYRNGHGLGIFM